LFKVSKSQMRHLEGGAAARFKREAVQHIRQQYAALTQHRDDAALLHYVEAMLAFCRSHGVVQRPNVLRMIDLQMEFAWAPPLDGYLAWQLGTPGFDEGVRVSQFALALDTPVHPEVIALDTPITLGAHP